MDYYTAGSLRIEGENYYITRKRDFSEYASIIDEDKENSFQFAFEMAYGEGYHRANRSGSDIKRPRGEIFINTFQGKLAEYALYRYLQEMNISVGAPDINVYGQGQWDSFDLECQGKHIAIKSTKDRGQLLLLETADWNENGEYIPNKDAEISKYDYFVLVRLKPDGVRIMSDANILGLEDSAVPQNIYDILRKEIYDKRWSYDFAGFIYYDEMVRMIQEKRIIPKNVKLNGRTVMQAENYYFQAGNMHFVKELFQPEIGAEMEMAGKLLGRTCPECGGKLILRKGQYSTFWGCTGYAKGCLYHEKYK